MATAKIAEAMNSIPKKKESLRLSLEAVKAYSSSLATFALEWKDLEDHLSAIEKSIEDRFRALEAKEKESPPSPSPPPSSTEADGDGEEAARGAELSSLCARMDAKGLSSFITSNIEEDLATILSALGPALGSAPDPPLLVLEVVEGALKPVPLLGKRLCINLLEKLQEISPEISPSVREKALKLAGEWKGKIPDKGDNSMDIMGFLQLIATYNLVAVFSHDEIMELYSGVSRRKQAFNLVKNLGLIENLPELIQKLTSKGRQIDAVRLAYTYNIVDQFPPIPLLQAYIKDVKKIAQEIKRKGQNSRQAWNEAISKEMGALTSVLKLVEEYKLEEFPRGSLERRMDQLEKEKANKKRNAAVAAAASNLKNQQQQPNKRPRPSATTSGHSMPADSYTPLVQTHPQPQPQPQPQTLLGRADHASYIAGPYAKAASGLVYNHAAPSLPATSMGHGGAPSPHRPYHYLSESYGTSGLYERPVTYSGYAPPGLPPSYPSLYP